MEAFALQSDVPRLPLPQRMLSDERLLRLVAAGNAQAFGAVYARYHAPLYSYCRSIVRDPDDARDALQNTMVKALAALGRAEERQIALKPWLFRIAHNESISLLRRRRPSEPLTDQLAPPVSGVEREVAARERLSELVEDLQELPERQRGALIMREVNGLSYSEIAAALSISEGAVRQSVFEARTALVEYGEGRDVACAHIRHSISDGDGRTLRARRVRAHLRACDGCRDFQLTLRTRRRDLALLAPGLSGGTAMALFQAITGSGAAGTLTATAAGSAGLLGGGASALLTSGAAKGVIALAAVAAAGAGAAHIEAPAEHRAAAHRVAAPAAAPAATVRTSPPGDSAGTARRAGATAPARTGSHRSGARATTAVRPERVRSSAHRGSARGGESQGEYQPPRDASQGDGSGRSGGGQPAGYGDGGQQEQQSPQDQPQQDQPARYVPRQQAERQDPAPQQPAQGEQQPAGQPSPDRPALPGGQFPQQPPQQQPAASGSPAATG